jgi:hypothetical protein
VSEPVTTTDDSVRTRSGHSSHPSVVERGSDRCAWNDPCNLYLLSIGTLSKGGPGPRSRLHEQVERSTAVGFVFSEGAECEA